MLTFVLAYFVVVAVFITLFRSAANADRIWEGSLGDLDNVTMTSREQRPRLPGRRDRQGSQAS